MLQSLQSLGRRGPRGPLRRDAAAIGSALPRRLQGTLSGGLRLSTAGSRTAGRSAKWEPPRRKLSAVGRE